MSKNPLSLKQLHQSDESITIEPERIPKYIIKPPAFSCPVSPDIMWHHGLEYKECPLIEGERDMPSCSNCKLRGDSKAKIKGKKHKPLRKNTSPKSEKPKVEKRHKEPIPNIGKTYVSE